MILHTAGDSKIIALSCTVLSVFREHIYQMIFLIIHKYSAVILRISFCDVRCVVYSLQFCFQLKIKNEKCFRL